MLSSLQLLVDRIIYIQSIHFNYPSYKSGFHSTSIRWLSSAEAENAQNSLARCKDQPP
jgi:hypothetical protein